MPRVINAFAQFEDGEGHPYVAGKLRFLVSGTTSTDKNTYADVNETVANSNPVLLDAEGRCPNVFGTGAYRVILYDSDDVQIQQFDPVGGDSGVSPFYAWGSLSIYGLGAVVTADDGNYYRSLIAANQGNDPTTSPASWEQIELLAYYNVNRTYAVNDIVLTANGDIYVSNAASNLGNTPSTSPTYWISPNKPVWLIKTTTYTAGVNEYIAFDTTAAAFTITLPGSPTDQDFVELKEAKTMASTNTLTIDRNGKTIMGLAEDMDIVTDNVTVRLTFFTATNDWRI